MSDRRPDWHLVEVTQTTPWLPEPNGRLIEELTAQRDLARDVAVSLENRLSAVEALHRTAPSTTCGHCIECERAWPCPTTRALTDLYAKETS